MEKRGVRNLLWWRVVARGAAVVLLLAGMVDGLKAQQGHVESAPVAKYPDLSPGAALDAVSRPVTTTRAVMSNWSDVELQALGVATTEARLECATRSPEMFHGSDLIALGRLCALGQQWSSVANAAALYIGAPGGNTEATTSGATPPSGASNLAEKPELATAYALAVEASLQMRQPMSALEQSEAMLKAVPYSTTTDATLHEAIHYLQLAFMDSALKLYEAREPYVLAALRSTVRPDGVGVAALEEDGLNYAALEQLAGRPLAASETVRALNAALSEAAPSADEKVLITQNQARYAMLGQPLPSIPATLSLWDVTETPRINTEYGSSTVLLLFPPWCAQCVRMAEGLLPVLVRVSEQNVHVYALLAEPTPKIVVPAPPPQPHKGRSRTPAAQEKHTTTDEQPKTMEQRLNHTPTLVVPESTVGRFYADGFPFMIATDSKGIVRFMQAAPENALVEGGLMDQVTAQIVRQWPPVGTKTVREAGAKP